MNEVPDGSIADLEAARGELRHQPAEREIPRFAPRDEPIPMDTPDRLGFVPAHLARPVWRKRCTQVIAVLTAMPKCAAA